MVKYSLLSKALWIRSGQFHPKLWDWDDYGLGYYPIRNKNYVKLYENNNKFLFKKDRRHMNICNMQ